MWFCYVTLLIMVPKLSSAQNTGEYLIAIIKIKFLSYSRHYTPKRVTSGAAHLRRIAPGKHRSEETLQQCRAVGDTVFP